MNALQDLVPIERPATRLLGRELHAWVRPYDRVEKYVAFHGIFHEQDQATLPTSPTSPPPPPHHLTVAERKQIVRVAAVLATVGAFHQ